MACTQERARRQAAVIIRDRCRLNALTYYIHIMCKLVCTVTPGGVAYTFCVCAGGGGTCTHLEGGLLAFTSILRASTGFTHSCVPYAVPM